MDNFEKYSASLESIADEIAPESDVAAVILIAAKVDEILTQCISKRLFPSPNKKDELFGKYGPMSSLAAKIDICYRLGIVEKSMVNNLHLLRKIRNDFAHMYAKQSLGDQSHKQRILNFDSAISESIDKAVKSFSNTHKISEEEIKKHVTIRMRFNLIASHIVSTLLFILAETDQIEPIKIYERSSPKKTADPEK